VEDREKGKPRISVRNYHRRDRADVLRIAVESFGGVCLDENVEKQFGKIGRRWQDHKEDTIDYDLGANSASAFVAEVNGKVVGFLCARLYYQRSTGHVANLAVAPDCQGMGVGKALIQAALDHFRDRGMQYARIETLEQNIKAKEFYPAVGFKEVGRQIFYFMKL